MGSEKTKIQYGKKLRIPQLVQNYFQPKQKDKPNQDACTLIHESVKISI